MPRSRKNKAHAIEYLGIGIDHKRQCGFRDGRLLDLTAAEFRLLDCFLSNPGRTLTREKLLAAVTEEKAIVSPRAVDVHVCALRQKVGLPNLIKTIRGVGYCLEALPQKIPTTQDSPQGETT